MRKHILVLLALALTTSFKAGAQSLLENSQVSGSLVRRPATGAMVRCGQAMSSRKVPGHSARVRWMPTIQSSSA